MKIFDPLLEENQRNKQCSDNWLFQQMTGLVKQINYQDRLTSNEDLEQYTNMDSDFYQIYFELQQLQQQSKERSEFHRSILYKLFPRRIVRIAFYEIISNSNQLINLVLLDEITNSIETYQTDNNFKPFIYLMLLAFFSIMRALFQSLAMREINLVLVRMRISINYLIFQKILSGQVGEINNGKDTDYVANINNLILTDVDKIMLLQHSIQDGIAAIILLAGCLTILFIKNAQAGIYVIIIIVLAQIYNVFSSFLMMKAEQVMLKFKDQRIGLSTDLIEGMKQIKYLTWEETFSKQIMYYRKKEFMMLIVAKICDGLLGIFWNNVNYILLYAYLTNALKHGSLIGDLNVFTLIAIFKTLIFPLGIIPFCINFTMEASVSLKRIMDYVYTNDIETKFQKQDCSTDAISISNCQAKWPKISVQNDDDNDKSDDDNNDAIQEDSHKFQLTIKRLNIKFNTLTFIVGKIGSGKSALLNCILNEMEQLETQNNSLIVNGTICYCSQQSWVQNQTIQQNILFGKKMDLQFYEKVLEVCQLQSDLQQFEKRDLHLIGPDGKNLSGGQKQRITIARSIYTDSDIYLFDDIFSSLDVHVSDVLFRQAIIQFLIGRQKTVVFVTSHYRHIFSVPSNVVKQVILLDNGQIEFNEQQIQNFLKENPDHDNKEDIIDTPLINKVESQTVHQLVEEELEEREIGSVNISTWLFYFRSMNWGIFISYFLFSILMQVSLSFIDFWLKSQLTQDQSIFKQIDEYFKNNFSNIFLFLLMIAFIITLSRSILYIFSALGAAWRIFRKLNNILTWSNMKFYDTTNSGRIVNRLSNDIEEVDTELPWSIDVMMEIFTRVLGYMVGLIIMLPQISFIIILVFFIYYHIAKLYMKTNVELKRLKQVNNSSILQWINETSGGIKIIRCQNQQEYFEQNYCNKFKNWINTDQCCERAKLWFTVRLNLASNLMLIGSIFLIIVLLLFNYDKYSSLFALSLTYSVLIIESFFDLFEFYLLVEQNMVAVERIKQYFNNPQENIDHHKFIKVENPIKDTSITIQFKSIYLAYDESNHLALNNISFVVHKGEKVAFLGRTGSGKTSIFNVLFGLYPFKGELLINGENADYLSLREQRNSLSIVPQFGFLFNGSVKENIDPQNNIEKQALEDLLQDSVFHLRKKESEMNCDFLIAQNGSNLSNGEKQLLNFMRIISQNKEIVCLDEATSNMDPETDKDLHNLLFKYVENRTLLTITHRLENIEKYDKIIIMDKGEIVEQGKYTDLIQNPNGSLFNLIQNKQQNQNACK